jgi:hypothetical protein
MARDCDICGSPMNSADDCLFDCPNGCPVYELEPHDHQTDDWLNSVTIVQARSDAEILEHAKKLHAARWPEVRLKIYQVPFVNHSSMSGWDKWPEKMRLVAVLEPLETNGD